MTPSNHAPSNPAPSNLDHPEIKQILFRQMNETIKLNEVLAA